MKKVWYLLFLIIVSILSIETIFAYNINSSNNPGVNYNEKNGSFVTTTTAWYNPYLRAVRIRIFRGSTQIASSYYSIVDSSDKCYGSVSNVELCETSKYDYSINTDSTGVTCSSKGNVNLGCIATSNLTQTWNVESYDGTYLDNYFKENQYSNLKDILLGMGYNDTNYNNNDVVIIEPATLVGCAGTSYFGTSTSLMKKNISYSGSTNNVCAANDNFYDTSNKDADGNVIQVTGVTFSNLFMSMSKALKISSSCSKTNYSGCGYFLYNVSGMGYEPTNGSVEIKKVSTGTNTPIISSSTEFKIYKGANCSGSVFKTVRTDSRGKVTLDDLEEGVYSVYESVVPTGYIEPVDRCVIRSFEVTLGENLSLTVENTGGCDSKLTEIKNSELSQDEMISSLIDLNREFPGFNGLLNFSNPSCNKVSCNTTYVDGCLKINSLNVATDDLDFSCGIKKDNGVDYSICKSEIFTLTNEINTDIFYGIAGRFLIKKKSANVLEIYDSNYDPVEVSNIIATAEVERKCVIQNWSRSKSSYSYHSGTELSEFDDTDANPEINIYFNGVQLSLESDNYDNALNQTYLNRKSKTTCRIECPCEEPPCACCSWNYKYKWQHELTHTFTYKFSLDENKNFVYLEKLTGKVFSTPEENTVKNVGIISRFDSKQEFIPFKIEYDGATIESDACKVHTEEELVKETVKLELEFRIVDTKNPFVGKLGLGRETRTNWCDGDNCDPDNDTVEDFIKNRVNSYGLDEDGNRHNPIYKITLTPADIEKIREYNDANEYDNYETITVGGDTYNSFVYDLINGSVGGKSISHSLETN